MDYLIVVGHFLGSIVSLIALKVGYLYFASWREQKEREDAAEEVSLTLGITIDELDDTQNTDKVVDFYSSKYSPERFTNRLSDFCALIRTVWVWLGFFAQLAFIGFMIWVVIEQSLRDAKYVWLCIGISLFVFVSSVVFSYVTKLVTGRYPGEAKNARALLVDFIDHQKRQAERESALERIAAEHK